MKKKRRQKQRELWRSILFEQASELNAQWQVDREETSSWNGLWHAEPWVYMAVGGLHLKELLQLWTLLSMTRGPGGFVLLAKWKQKIHRTFKSISRVYCLSLIRLLGVSYFIVVNQTVARKLCYLWFDCAPCFSRMWISLFMYMCVCIAFALLDLPDRSKRTHENEVLLLK